MSQTNQAIGALRRVTHADLPCVKTRRWMPGHKVQVVRGVDAGLITAEEACRRYGLQPEELESWRLLAARGGEEGLCLSGRRRERPAKDSPHAPRRARMARRGGGTDG